jgi:hypothetical protein
MRPATEDPFRPPSRRLIAGAGLALLGIVGGCNLDALFSDPPRGPGDGPSPPSALAFVTQPTGARVNEPITPAPEIVVRDSAGEPDTTFNGPVILTLDAGGSDATLAGTTTRDAVDGVVVFPDLAVDVAGTGYRLVAAAAGIPSVSSAPFEISEPDDEDPEPSALIIVSGNGQSGTVGLSLGSPYVVRVADAAGDPITGVSVAWSVTAGAGSVSATTSTTDASGQASTTHTLGAGVGTQSVRAAVSGLSPVDFSATAVAGVAEELIFTVQPSNTTVGVAITPAVEVTARDEHGNRASGFTGAVTLTLGSGSGSLGGVTTRAAAGGIVSFPGLTVSAAGTGYRLAATAPAVSGATSTAFNVLAPDEEEPEPTDVEIASGNGQTGTVGEPLATPYRVRVVDTDGAPVPGVSVGWSVTSGGGSVSPSTPTTNSSGVASATHTLGPGIGAHSVRASVGALPSVTFTSTAVAGSASGLFFTTQPSSSMVGEAITPAVEVTARDAHGNRATTFAGTVTLTLEGGGGTLGGTTVRPASGGVASFPGLTVSEAGTGYRLSAAASGVAGVTSSTFVISPSEEEPQPADIEIVSGNGQTGAIGDALAAPYRVRVTDTGGDPVPGVSVSWTVTSGGGSVSPGSSTTNSGGEASATHTLGTGTGAQSVRAAVSGISPVTFTSTAVAGSASVLVFTVQPSSSLVGEAITPAVEITARDENGNRATSFSGTVTLMLASGGGGGTLAGTIERAASSGVATFPGLSISAAGTGYRISASAFGVAGVTSAAFNILEPEDPDPVPTQVAIVSGNGQGGTVGEALDDPYVVRVTDADGDPMAGVTVSWTVTSGGGSLSSGSSATNSSGQASTTHTLGGSTGSQSVRATVAGLSPVTFTATAEAGAPAQLVFTTQPSDAAMGETISPPVRVTVRDEYGNVATNFSGSITLGIVPLTGTPLASLDGTRTRSVSGGHATFDDLSINLVGVLYRLRASGAGHTADSAPFNILLLP